MASFVRDCIARPGFKMGARVPLSTAAPASNAPANCGGRIASSAGMPGCHSQSPYSANKCEVRARTGKKKRKSAMTHDSEYFERLAAEARAAASRKDETADVEVAGDLALAYAALARRRAKEAEVPAIPLDEPAA
jgi:hypothetical protein